MYSIYDGSVVTNLTKMHSNYITQILVTKDSKKVITCSKDKKIKVWDWIKSKLIANLIGHQDSVESIVLSKNEKLLFSGSYDKNVHIWSLESYFLLGTLKTKFPIRNLMMNEDNENLLAHGKYFASEDWKTDKRDIAYWSL